MTPLAGIKVLDLSRLLPGPVASLVLADLGAQVDKLEDAGAGDYLRAMPPLVGSSDAEPTSSMFLTLNRNKRSIVLDLKRPEGRDAFLRLVRGYDVVLEQFRPGVLGRLGLAHETLLAAQPRLVVCALTGYGQTGPLRNRAGHDLDYLARAGVLGFQGPSARAPGEAPAVPGVQLADISGALYAVLGIMGALMERSRTATGGGRVVDVAMVETAMPFAIAGFGAIFGGADVSAGRGIVTGGIAPYGTYCTKDGRVMALGALEPKFWIEFCAGVELGREVEMSDFLPGPHQVELIRAVREVFAGRTQAEWIAFAAERDCCLEPVLDPAEARRDPHLAARGMFFDLATPWGTIPQLRTPLTPIDREHRPPPRRGEHSEEILREAGFGAAEIEALSSCGVLPRTPSRR
jgi:crotonobetainyl-CoA:carnitine CoA-transferase CaiB-like acyl-CoA transferase